MKKMKVRRFYTNKSHKIMKRVRIGVMILTSPLWFPFYGLAWVFYHLSEIMDSVVSFLDNLLQNILDKVIPQIK